MTGSVTLRDRRDLPFFIIRLRALQEIRNNISGPRRARALGLYALLCQIANEQRSDGEQVRLVATSRELTRRGGLSPRMLKALSAALNAAGAARFETRIDPLRGAMPSLIHLTVQDGPWVALTVTTATRLAQQPAALLPVLGLLVGLLELCDEQRATLGGLRAETTRADVARRVGCSTDTLDAWVKALVGADVLSVTRRRGPDGGHLPNLWAITEPTTEQLAENGNQPRRTSETAPPDIGNSPAANGKHPPGAAELSSPQISRDLADDGKRPPGKSATPVADPRRLNARAASGAETPSTEQGGNPPSPLPTNGTGGEGDDAKPDIVICTELVEVLNETRGPAPGRRYDAAAAEWHAAAGRVLADHPLEKVREAIAYLPFDQIVGTKVRSMPDLERHIEDLRHRAHAAKAQQRAAPAAAGHVEGLSWPEAKGELMRAVQRHGAGEKAAALEALGERHPQLRRFAEQVGWGSLCTSPIEKQDYAYRMAWDALSRHAATEEAA